MIAGRSDISENRGFGPHLYHFFYPVSMRCCFEAEDVPEEFGVRLESFLSDRNLQSVLGTRRTDRNDLVMTALDSLRASGTRVSLFPSDIVDDPEAVLFLSWRDIDEAYLGEHPHADVIFGQDLCHQVPALVRILRQNRGINRRPVG